MVGVGKIGLPISENSRALDGGEAVPTRAGRGKALFHYFHMIEQWADETGTATPLLDRTIELPEMRRHGAR